MLASWRLLVCLGILFVIFTVITLSFGIAGVVLGYQVIDKDEKSDLELQAAEIIIDALQSWDEPLISDIYVIDADSECEGD